MVSILINYETISRASNNFKISSIFSQITDVQLAIFSNIVGVLLFLLVVGYHYIAANSARGQHLKIK